MIPRVNPNIDILNVPLDAKDGFLLSRIDGATSLETLADIVGQPIEAVREGVQRLQRLGVVQGVLHPEPTAAVSKPMSAGALSEQERADIDAARAVVRRGNFWEILGLGGDPSAGEIKAAYFRQSKRFHPDRFFGRDLGSYGSELEQIFQAIKQAYEVLAHDASRLAYGRKVPPPVTDASLPSDQGIPSAAAKAAPSAAAAPISDHALEAHRQALIEARKEARKKRQPKGVVTAAGRGKGEVFYRAGLLQLAAGDGVAASSSFRVAISFEPENQEYKSQLEAAMEVANGQRAHALAQQGQTLAVGGQAAEAARLLGEAASLVPRKSGYAVRAAEQFLRCQDTTRALRYASMAVQAAPQSAEVLLLAAEIHHHRGELPAAAAVLGRAQALEPTHPRAKKLAKALQMRKP